MENNENLEQPKPHDYVPDGKAENENLNSIPPSLEDDDLDGDKTGQGNADDDEEDISGDLAGNASGNEDAEEEE